MPYIPHGQREILSVDLNILIDEIKDRTNPTKQLGILNYVITELIMNVLEPKSYGELAGAIGTLECAKLELYRRAAAPYEDKCRDDNGDIPSYANIRAREAARKGEGRTTQEVIDDMKKEKG